MDERRFSLTLFAVVIGLVGLGLVMIYSVSQPLALARAARVAEQSAGALTTAQIDRLVTAQERLVRKQAGFGLLGLAFMLGVMAAPLDLLKNQRLVQAFFLVCVALLALVLGAGIRELGSVRRVFGIQPSELAKVGLCAYLALVLSKLDPRTAATRRFIPIYVVVGCVLGLIILEPHLGCTLVVACTAMVVLFVAGAPLRQLLAITCAGGGAVVASMVVTGYQLDRVRVWLDPVKYYHGLGYQAVHCGTALSRGGLVGRGLGRSIEKFFYLPPESINDSIFAVLGEEMGFLGAATVAILFGIVAWHGLAVARRARNDRFAHLLAVGLTTMLFLQAMINLGVTSGLLPQTGVGLPFVSYGGSSLVASMLAAGLLLRLSMAYPALPVEDPEPIQPRREN